VPGGIVSTGLRPWIDIDLTPDRALLDPQGTAIAFELTLFNSGSAAARDVVVEARLLNAGAQQDVELSAFFAQLAPGDPIPQIAPYARIPLRSAVRLLRDEIREYEIEGRKLFVPLVAINVSIAGHVCSCAVEAQLRRLRDLGILVVAAAGNDGCTNDATMPDAPRCATWQDPSTTTCGSCPFYPASYPVSNVIAVGAATCSGAPQRCSNFGERSVHLYAPGHEVLTLGDPELGGGEFGHLRRTSPRRSRSAKRATRMTATIASPLASPHQMPTPRQPSWKPRT
jgi:hypothetical protein